jgi:sulfonate transport system substrate-binding protein
MTAAVVLTACSSSGSSSSTTAPGASQSALEKGVTLSVSNQTADFFALLTASGLFNNLPYTLKTSVIAGPAAQIAALDADQIDVGLTGDNTGAFQVANSPTVWTKANAPLEGIAVTYTPKATYPAPAVFVTTSSGINSLAELKGHTIGFNEGGNIQAGYVAALAKAGLAPSSVTPVQFASNQLAANAFDAGDLDAVVTSYTEVFNLVSTGKAKEIAGPSELGLIGGSGWLATTAALDSPGKLAAIKDFFTRLNTFYTKWYPTHEAAVVNIYETVDDQTSTLANLNFKNNQYTQFYNIGTKTFLQIEQTGVNNAFKDSLLKSDPNVDLGYSDVINNVLFPSSS